MTETVSKLSGNDLMVLGISTATDVKVFGSFCGKIMANMEITCPKSISSCTGKDYCTRKAKRLWTINKEGYKLLPQGKELLASLLRDAKLKSIYDQVANGDDEEEDASSSRLAIKANRPPARALMPVTGMHTPRKHARSEDSSPTVAELVARLDEAIEGVNSEMALTLWYSREFAKVETREQSMALAERYIVKKQSIATECASRIADLKAARDELVVAEKTAISTMKQQKCTR